MTAPSNPNPTRSKKQHPSQTARMVALATSVAATVGIAGAMRIADEGVTATTTAASASSASSATGASSSGSTTTYADGTYTGSAEDNGYGTIQVSVTVSGGKVSAVDLVQQPSDHRSLEINASAAPTLESEAVAAQSSTLDIVSGATYTSRAYASSLQAALDDAAQASDTTGSVS